MKLWISSKKSPDSSWTHCLTVNEALTLLDNLDIKSFEEVSLDYDLGSKAELFGGKGDAVLRWMAEEGKWPETLILSTQNMTAAVAMSKVVNKWGNYLHHPSSRKWTNSTSV